MSSSVLVVGRIWVGWLGGYLGGHQKDDLKTHERSQTLFQIEKTNFFTELLVLWLGPARETHLTCQLI